MSKTSVATRVISFAVLISLLLASFPTAAGFAKTNNQGLERKWAKLVASYNRQRVAHNTSQRWVELWMSANRKAPRSNKADLQKALVSANTAWASATVIAMRHNGFDSKGKVIDKAAAQQSARDLASALQRYAKALKELKALFRQFNKEE